MGNSHPNPDKSGPRPDVPLPALPAKVVMLRRPDYSTTQGKTGQAPPQLRDPYIRTQVPYLGMMAQICRSPGLIACLTSRCRGWQAGCYWLSAQALALGFSSEPSSIQLCATGHGMADSFLKEELDYQVPGRPFTVEFGHHRELLAARHVPISHLCAPTKGRARPGSKTHHTTRVPRQGTASPRICQGQSIQAR